MISKPRVFAVPHLGGPVATGGVAACDPYTCPSGKQCYNFTCDPFGDLGCVDTSYCGATLAIIGVIALIGPAPGPT